MDDRLCDKSGFKIVRMQACHLDALALLERECFSTPWSYEALAEELANPLAVFFVAEYDGEVVGYAGMQHVVDEGYITDIAVFEKFRRNGIANALLSAQINYAKENSLDFLTLEVRVSNEAAISLYTGRKFRQEGIRKDFYTSPKENAIIMTRKF